MIKGIIPINKPKDWTSFDVVNKVKHILKIRQVGHLGTLDPMATGVLLVTVGKATKLFDLMQTKTKTYLAKFKFGIETETLDITGRIVGTSKNIPNLDEIKSVIPKFIGDIEQIPPKFSAKSVNGKRAYDLARANIDFELKPCKVKVENIKIKSYENDEFEIELTCGSGTYIRAIGRDIAKELNTYACMTSLVRTKIDDFELKNCYDIDELNSDNIIDKIVKIRDILHFKELNIDSTLFEKLINGQIINIELPNGDYLLNNDVDCVALVKIVNFKAKMSIFFGI